MGGFVLAVASLIVVDATLLTGRSARSVARKSLAGARRAMRARSSASGTAAMAAATSVRRCATILSKMDGGTRAGTGPLPSPLGVGLTCGRGGRGSGGAGGAAVAAAGGGSGGQRRVVAGVAAAGVAAAGVAAVGVAAAGVAAAGRLCVVVVMLGCLASRCGRHQQGRFGQGWRGSRSACWQQQRGLRSVIVAAATMQCGRCGSVTVWRQHGSSESQQWAVVA